MLNCMCRCHYVQMPQQQHGRGELICQRSCIVYSEAFNACLGGIRQMRVREWRCWMCSWWSGWTEMEWGEEGAQQGEEGAQQGEEVGRLGAMHVP
ncbi:unnamed protein product [Boreogadus saida]